jgi:hypothetical protein
VLAAGAPEPVDPPDAQELFDELCAGNPLSGFGNISAFPHQAAGYEQVFDDAASACGVPDTNLARARGAVAGAMASNRLALERITDPAGDGFCGTMADYENITSELIGEVAETSGVTADGGGDFVELGVSILIFYCPDLLEAVTG